MKNLNQEGLNELSQEEATQIDGGSLREIINNAIDHVNNILEDVGIPIKINHI